MSGASCGDSLIDSGKLVGCAGILFGIKTDINVITPNVVKIAFVVVLFIGIILFALQHINNKMKKAA